jgi:uncharacterized protein YcbX
MPTIVKTTRFPVKGMRGEEVPELYFDPDIGVVGDRQYVLPRRPNYPHEWRKEVKWAPKGAFHVCQNTPQAAAVQPTYAGAFNPKGPRLLEEGFRSTLRQRLRVDEGPPLVSTRGDFNMTDEQGANVSLLNLASWQEVEQRVGKPLDPRRLRMNLWVDGWEPWAELALVNGFPGTREIRLGGHRGVVLDVLTRCEAINADPDTGVADLDLLGDRRPAGRARLPMLPQERPRASRQASDGRAGAHARALFPPPRHGAGGLAKRRTRPVAGFFA